jgi:hypothetical protein
VVQSDWPVQQYQVLLACQGRERPRAGEWMVNRLEFYNRGTPYHPNSQLSRKRCELDNSLNLAWLELSKRGCVSCTRTELIPGAPTLSSPPNNAVGIDIEPTLSCGTVAGAVWYTLQISSDPNFTTILVNQVGGSTFNPTALPAGTKCYWRVNALNAGPQAGQWSSVRNFTTGSVYRFKEFFSDPTTRLETDAWVGTVVKDGATPRKVYRFGFYRSYDAAACVPGTQPRNTKGHYNAVSSFTDKDDGIVFYSDFDADLQSNTSSYGQLLQSNLKYSGTINTNRTCVYYQLTSGPSAGRIYKVYRFDRNLVLRRKLIR